MGCCWKSHERTLTAPCFSSPRVSCPRSHHGTRSRGTAETRRAAVLRRRRESNTCVYDGRDECCGRDVPSWRVWAVIPSAFSRLRLSLAEFSLSTMKINGAHREGPAVYATQRPSGHSISALGAAAPRSVMPPQNLESGWQTEPTVEPAVLLVSSPVGCHPRVVAMARMLCLPTKQIPVPTGRHKII